MQEDFSFLFTFNKANMSSSPLAMAEKRKMSTRSGGEPPLKKHASSPPLPSVEQVEEELPISLNHGEDLPTLPIQQDKNLPDAQYQSIAARFVTLLPGLLYWANRHLELVVFYQHQSNDLDRPGLLGGFSNDTGLNPRRKRLLSKSKIRQRTQ